MHRSWWDLMHSSMRSLFLEDTESSDGQDLKRSLNSPLKKNTSRKIITWVEDLTFRGILPFSLTNNEKIPLFPTPSLWFCKPHLSHRSVEHCYSCYCSHFQEKRRNWLSPTARSQKISADCHCHLTTGWEKNLDVSI